MYVLLKWLHILAVVVALGSNLTYFLWLSRASREPGAAPAILRTVQFLDSRIANPAYALVLVTGVFLVFTGDRSFETPWVATAIALFLAVMAVGGMLYSPLLRRQVREVEQAGTSSQAYQRAAKRGNLVGTGIVLAVVVILYLMVAKPSLWD